MILNDLAKRAGKFTIDNSPLILTAIGVTGVVTTAVLTGKASFKAAKVLDEYFEDIPLKHKINHTWKLYIPAALTGVATIAAIVGANQIGTRRAAALASAYTLSIKAFDEYKHKVVETIGEHKERAIQDDVAQSRVNDNPSSQREVLYVGRGEVQCCELYTGRYFNCDMETLKKAQNDLNYRINNDGYASLSDFYDLLDLPHTAQSDEVGWSSEKKLLELRITTVLNDKGEPCIAFDYDVEPIRKFFRFG